MQITAGDRGIASLKTTCQCAAGKGQCSHVIGLLYMISHWQRLGLQSVPPVESKTSLPQAWHIPRRTAGLEPQNVMSLSVKRVKPQKSEKIKRRKTVDCVQTTLYCPIPNLKAEEFSDTLVHNLSRIQKPTQMLQVLKSASSQDCVSVTTKYGTFRKGSVLAYQLPKPERSSTILHFDDIQFPEFQLPFIESKYCTVLSLSHSDFWQGIHLTRELSIEYEKITRAQSKCPEWHQIRKYRLTSSRFKAVCRRTGDFASLASRLAKNKQVTTQAMLRGIEMEPQAAESYAATSGNNVYPVGLVINPSCPHLGTSPDRGVYDPAETPQFGLLEIKCPVSPTITSVKYLKEVGNIRKLRHSHEYYYQIMGQMALTGMRWCDLYVYCEDDFHLERIYFNPDLWSTMKQQLDLFYFEYMIPQYVT